MKGRNLGGVSPYSAVVYRTTTPSGSHTLAQPTDAMPEPDHGRTAAAQAGGSQGTAEGFRGAQPLPTVATAAPV